MPDTNAAAAWTGYENAFVLDMLATPTPFNIEGIYDHPLSEAMVRNAARSGITAVNATVSQISRALSAFEDAVSNIAFWQREIAAHPGVLMKIGSIADIREAKRTGRVGIIPGFQDGTAFDDKVERVDLFYDLGLRIVQFTYNSRNLLADGCMEPADSGLSRFGMACIERMNERGMLVDLSHVGLRSSWDALKVSKKPPAITHSGARAVADLPRNKPDDLLRAVADRGGVVGAYMIVYLREEGQPRLDDFMRHLDHLLKVCGEDHVGIGSDLSITPLDLTPEFKERWAHTVRVRRATGRGAKGEAEDVYGYIPELNSPRRLDLLAAAMSRAGHPDSRIAKVLGGNWMRLLGEVWKG